MWGVVTWVDVDPRIDYYIVYRPGADQRLSVRRSRRGVQEGDAPGTGRKFIKKTLQLNFWRPGDTIDPHEEEIRYGCRIDVGPGRTAAKILAEFGIDKPIDHLWLYR